MACWATRGLDNSGCCSVSPDQVPPVMALLVVGRPQMCTPPSGTHCGLSPEALRPGPRGLCSQSVLRLASAQAPPLPVFVELLHVLVIGQASTS